MVRLATLLLLVASLGSACGSAQHAASGNALARPHESRHTAAVHTARTDPTLSARIVARRSLAYADGADAAQDRPAYVRAASGLAWVGERLAIVQDDAHFVALADPETGFADVIALPADAEGRRLFDDTRGLKHLKHDLESCFARTDADGRVTLLVFGSGSTERRTRIVRLHFATPRALPDVQVIDAAALYAGLTAERRFSGSALNVEGVLARGDELLLLQRGNGAPSGEVAAVNAIGVLSLAALDRYLAGDPAVPPLTAVQQFDLGRAEDVPYGFTDATLLPDGQVLFVASAEDSQSTVADGAVLGTVLGIIDGDGAVRTTPLRDEHGSPSRLKVEGIALDPHDPTRAFMVVDVDDPARPSELLEVQLTRT